MKNILYIFIGIFFGVLLIKSEAASWFRIYEMFQFQSFHMYGIIGSAVGLGVLSVGLLKRFNAKNIMGNQIIFSNKDRSLFRYLIGGILFGLGWALSGACPGPMFTLFGAGFLPILISIIGALLGTWAYGLLKDKLPH
ncbi:MAG: DUF6691 family protein [Flavobacteriaceae bacterium]